MENTAKLNDMIGKLITMKPYLEGHPEGALQIQFAKAHVQIDILYQQWLRGDSNEEQYALEEEWIEEGETIQDDSQHPVPASRTKEELERQPAGVALSIQSGRVQGMEDSTTDESITDQPLVATTAPTENNPQMTFKFNVKNRVPLDDQNSIWRTKLHFSRTVEQKKEPNASLKAKTQLADMIGKLMHIQQQLPFKQTLDNDLQIQFDELDASVTTFYQSFQKVEELPAGGKTNGRAALLILAPNEDAFQKFETSIKTLSVRPAEEYLPISKKLNPNHRIKKSTKQSTIKNASTHCTALLEAKANSEVVLSANRQPKSNNVRSKAVLAIEKPNVAKAAQLPVQTVFPSSTSSYAALAFRPKPCQISVSAITHAGSSKVPPPTTPTLKEVIPVDSASRVSEGYED
ncbi:hypothetical protein EG329_002996 [Mollisiaceae sp. DMI_Dod_QoI]|nr:hypothetical protein EG329_002996 [Helotiales sp. DMI_Dod_QoI]